MNKEALKKLAEISMQLFKSKKRTANLVQWASLYEGRAEKMTNYLKNNPEVSYAQINNVMAKIVFQEVTKTL